MDLAEILERPKEVRRRERVPIDRFVSVQMHYQDIPEVARRCGVFMVRIPQQFTITQGCALQPQMIRSAYPARVVGHRGTRALVRIELSKL